MGVILPTIAAVLVSARIVPGPGSVPQVALPLNWGSPHPMVSYDPPFASVRPQDGLVLGEDSDSPTALGLNWTSSTVALFTQYAVLESPNGSAGSWITVAVTTSQATTSYTVAGLTPGATYFWQVSATGWLSTQSSKLASFAQPTLAFLTVTVPSPTRVTMNWTDNASYGRGVSFLSFSAIEKAASGAPTVVGTVTNASNRTFTGNGLTSGASYSFMLETTDCVGGCGSAAPSEAVTESNIVTVGTPLPLTASLQTERSVADVGQPVSFT